MVLTLSVIAIFFSVFVLALLLLIMPAAQKREVGKSLDQVVAYDQPAELADPDKNVPLIPFGERVIAPSLHKLLTLGKKITPLGMVDYYKRQIILAGKPKDLNVDRFLALKTVLGIGALVLLIFLLVFTAVSKSRLVTVGAVMVPLAFFLPDLWLLGRAEKRQKEIRLALPDTLDLLTISVEAGLGFDAALTKVIKNSRGPLAEECSKMLTESRIGVSRKDALKNLADRTSSPDIRAFVTAMIQADIFGISISKVLRTQASQIRLKRRQRAEEIAMKAPVKIVFPVVFCILPSLFVVILGPAVIRIVFSLLPILTNR